MNNRLNSLINKCEVMSNITIKASYYWSKIKFMLSIPLILTNSVLCILNSLSEPNTNLKIPNVIVNSISVLLLSISNNLKSAEKLELFKNLSNQFLLLTHEMESIEPGLMDREKINMFQDKYDNLITQVLFEEIPQYIKTEVSILFKNTPLPSQLNGGSILRRKTGLTPPTTPNNINAEVGINSIEIQQ